MLLYKQETSPVNSPPKTAKSIVTIMARSWFTARLELLAPSANAGKISTMLNKSLILESDSTSQSTRK